MLRVTCHSHRAGYSVVLGACLGQNQKLRCEYPSQLGVHSVLFRVLAVLAYPVDSPGQHSLVADKVVEDMRPAPTEGTERFEDSHLEAAGQIEISHKSNNTEAERRTPS